MFDNQIWCGFLPALIVLFISDSTYADRVLSETTVGDALVYPLPIVSTDPPISSEPKPSTPPELILPPSLETIKPSGHVMPTVGVERSVPLKVWFTSGKTAYRSSSASTDVTDLVFDPVGSSFSLGGRETSVGLGIPVAGSGPA